MNKPQLLQLTIKLLDKRFPPAPPPAERPVTEELVYALLREGATSAQADAAFKRFKDGFFDWNEVRVSSVPEVADTLRGLPDAGAKAKRVIEFLQDLFEMDYTFALDGMEKKGLKQAAKQIGRYQGVTDFAVGWVTQRSLGGHAVPLDAPALRVLRRLGLVDADADADDIESIRGSIEHHVPKAKGPDLTEHLALHAAEICMEKPDCPHCPLKNDCPTGIELLSKKADPKPKPKSR